MDFQRIDAPVLTSNSDARKVIGSNEQQSGM